MERQVLPNETVWMAQVADGGVKHVHLAALEGHGAFETPVLSYAKPVDETSSVMNCVLKSPVDACLFSISERLRCKGIPVHMFPCSTCAEVGRLAVDTINGAWHPPSTGEEAADVVASAEKILEALLDRLELKVAARGRGSRQRVRQQAARVWHGWVRQQGRGSI